MRSYCFLRYEILHEILRKFYRDIEILCNATIKTALQSFKNF